jgi:hypothetical protein
MLPRKFTGRIIPTHSKKIVLPSGHHGAWLFKHQKVQISNLQKKLKKIPRCSQLYTL